MNSINKTLEKWLSQLNNFSYKSYEELPDIDLYMDQVVTYLDKQLQIFQTSTLDKQITPSMINNYVKGEVVSAPITKKYNREHIALIEEVCTLKQVLTIAEVKQLIDERYRKNEVDKSLVFNHFNDTVNLKNKEAIKLTKSELSTIQENDTKALTELALDLACTANAYNIIAKRILFLTKLYQEQLKNKEEKTEEK